MILGCLKTLKAPNTKGDPTVYEVEEDQDLLNLHAALQFKKARGLQPNEFVIIDNAEPLANLVRRHRDEMTKELGAGLVQKILADSKNVAHQMQQQAETMRTDPATSPLPAQKATREHVTMCA